MTGPVIMKVRVELGDERITRFQSDKVTDGYGYYENRPAAVGIIRAVTLWFGEGPVSRRPRTTKQLRVIARIHTDPPSEADWAAATEQARADMTVLAAKHGLTT